MAATPNGKDVQLGGHKNQLVAQRSSATCDCSAKAPTYPVFRRTQHLPECRLYIEEIRREKIAALVDNTPAKHLGIYQNVWEIRGYDMKEFWVACFFHCDLWHEHVTADTEAEVLELAKQRIDQRIAEGR